MAVFLFSMQGISQNDNTSSGKNEFLPIINGDTEILKKFTRAFLDYLNGTPHNIFSFYFSMPEAIKYNKKLILLNYPEADSSLAKVVIAKNSSVKSKMRQFLGEYNRIELINLVFREGYSSEVDAYLLQYKLGDENGWNERFSIQLIRYENTLKIFSLKE